MADCDSLNQKVDSMLKMVTKFNSLPCSTS